MHVTVNQNLNCWKGAKLHWLQSSFVSVQIASVAKADLLGDYSGARVRTPPKSSYCHPDCFSRVRHEKGISHRDHGCLLLMGYNPVLQDQRANMMEEFFLLLTPFLTLNKPATFGA